jgi:type III pantothenate kinase
VKLLCDIGNTTYSFYDGVSLKKESAKRFNPSVIKEKVYYISVNYNVNRKLYKLNNWINLEKYIDRKNFYKTMGIDRIFATLSVDNGIIVDVGSAITVDVVKKSKFEGGFIYPGISAFKKAYSDISPALECEFDFGIDFSNLPKNTVSALSYGFLAGFKKEVESYNLPIILTGGDGELFLNIFKNAVYDKYLIFKGMQKVLS